MFPSRLVFVRRYRYREEAHGDQRLLFEAGLEPHLKHGDESGGVDLVVPEGHSSRALKLLALSPQLLPTSQTKPLPACPACRSRDADPRPSYSLMVLGVGAAVSIGIAAIGRVGSAFGLTTATAVVSAIVHARTARWRCRKCGRLYGAAEG